MFSSPPKTQKPRPYKPQDPPKQSYQRPAPPPQQHYAPSKPDPVYIPAPSQYNKPPIIIYQGVRPPVHVYEKPKPQKTTYQAKAQAKVSAPVAPAPAPKAPAAPAPVAPVHNQKSTSRAGHLEANIDDEIIFFCFQTSQSSGSRNWVKISAAPPSWLISRRQTCLSRETNL